MSDLRARLHLAPDSRRDLWTHLLQDEAGREQAAFGFAAVTRARETLTFDLLETRPLARHEFVYQGAAGIELTDSTRAGVIKRAHDLGASLVEFHSHPGRLPAAFSLSDLAGFREFVPHVWWRLGGKPYAAVVVAPAGFDAVAWLESPDRLIQLDAIVAGTEILRATGHTLSEAHRGHRAF